MDELLALIIRFMEQLEGSIDAIDDSEASEISEFLIETMTFLMQGQGRGQEEPPGAPPMPPVEAPLGHGETLLWILSGGQEDAFVNYLRTYPDPSLQSLLQSPDLLRATIDRLSRELPQGANRGEADGVPRAPLDSSNIYGFQYDPKSGFLKVRFQSGSVYAYQGVPSGVFRVFQNGAVPARTNGQNEHGRWWQGKIPSLGAAFYQMIRQGGYPYQRLS